MPRGGYRTNAGGKPTWNHGKTKVIRVPVDLADEVLAIARLLDEGKLPNSETELKVIDLKGVSIHAHRDGPVVYLDDLLRVGYQIEPERLVRSLKLRGDKRSGKSSLLSGLLESEKYE